MNFRSSWHGNSYPDIHRVHFIDSEVVIRRALLQHISMNWELSVNRRLLMMRWFMATQACRVNAMHSKEQHIMEYCVYIWRFQGAIFCGKKGNALHETWACIIQQKSCETESWAFWLISNMCCCVSSLPGGSWTELLLSVTVSCISCLAAMIAT